MADNDAQPNEGAQSVEVTERKRFDITERGGRYLTANGKAVNANGEPLAGSGELEDHTVDELREMATEQDINLEGASRKADIITRIRDASNS